MTPETWAGRLVSHTGFHLGAGLCFGFDATTMASGGASCIFMESGYPTARPLRRPDACTRSETPSCA